MAIRPGKNIKLKTPAKDAAKEATLARNDDDALKMPPRTDGAATGKETGGSSLDVFNAPAAGSAASKASAAREAAAKPLDNETPGLAREEERTGTNEASTGIAERLNEGFEDILDRANKEVLGEDMGAGEQEDGTGASRDSGKGGLQRLVDQAFPTDDGASGGGGLGRIGTPEDLGVTGGIGAQGGPDSGSGVGLDVFDVNLSGLRGSTAASGSSDELGLMRGIASGTDADPSAGPSVADEESGGVALLRQAIQEANDEAAARGSGTSGAGGGSSPAPEPKGQEAAGQGSSQPAEEPSMVSRALEWFSRTVYDRPLMGEAGGGGTGGQGNVNAAEQMKQVDDGLGATPQEATTIGQALNKQGVNNLETAVGKALGSGKKGPGTDDPGPEGSGVSGLPTPEYMAWRAAARARLGLGQGGSGDIDPSEGGAAEAVHSGPAPTPLEAGLAQKAMREFLVGQPSGIAVGGGGSIGAGTLPGDSGDVDPGEGYTGAWTSDTRTESESEALDSFGGSGLTIGDAHRKDDAEDDEEENEDDTGDES